MEAVNQFAVASSFAPYSDISGNLYIRDVAAKFTQKGEKYGVNVAGRCGGNSTRAVPHFPAIFAAKY
jgi:hypothetical protein